MEQSIVVERDRLSWRSEAQRSEGLKNNGAGGQSGQSRYDGSKQAVWQRLQDVLAMPPKPDPLVEDLPAPANPATDPPQKDSPRADLSPQTQTDRSDDRASWVKPSRTEIFSAPEKQYTVMRENDLYPARSSWLRTGFEDRRVLVTPPPAEPVVAESQNEAIPEDNFAQTAPSWNPIEDMAVASEPQPATAEPDSSTQASSWTPDTNLGGEMWQTTTFADAAEPTTSAYNGETQPGHDVDSSRWFVLKGVLGGATAQQETPGIAPAKNVPVLEVFSLAGGVGKTSLVATLGRALSARGERVLLVEPTPFGSLPYFFGACDCRPGVLRNFRPPASSTDAPIRLATVDSDTLQTENGIPVTLASDIEGWARGVSRVIVDVETRSTATARGLSRMSPLVLVPLIPDVNSVLTANSIDSFFQRSAAAPGGHTDVYYLLNQYDPSLPLHSDVRMMLREHLGDRLLPFTLQRTPAISEALAEGMTIMDYAPESSVVEDFTGLAKWLEDVLAPADMNPRGIRWSER